MKQFSPQEKQLILSIYNNRNDRTYVLANVFNQWLYGEDKVSFDLESGDLLFEPSKNPTEESTLDVQNDIIQTALLIKYLEDNGYIYIIEDNTSTTNKSTVFKNKFNPVLRVELPRGIAHIISRSLYRVYVSYSLIKLIENDFKEYEELQLIYAQEQSKIAAGSLSEARFQSNKALWTMWASIIVCVLTAITLLVNIYYSRCAQDGCKKNNVEYYTAEIDVEVVNSQLEQIKNYLLQIIDLNASLTNNFNITPKVHISPRNKKVSSKKKCPPAQQVLKVDTIICNGETYWVLPCPQSESQKN